MLCQLEARRWERQMMGAAAGFGALSAVSSDEMYRVQDTATQFGCTTTPDGYGGVGLTPASTWSAHDLQVERMSAPHAKSSALPSDWILPTKAVWPIWNGLEVGGYLVIGVDAPSTNCSSTR